MGHTRSRLQEEQEPCYVISVAARLLGVHAQTLRYYERVGIVEPSRSRGNIRLYSAQDIERLRQVKRLVDDLGVNLAGVEVILNLTERIALLERELQALRAEADRLRRLVGTPARTDGTHFVGSQHPDGGTEPSFER